MRLYRIIGSEGRITIPFAIRQEIGFLPDDVVSFQIVDADSVLVRRESLREQERTAPVSKPDASLFDYLESLSPKEQYTALVHLKVLWAQSHGGTGGMQNE